ncbi:MAG: UvrD-helicase domain-containing protein, partial [Clostridia bacterium]|nr:UvrD-helicase domain-containing protein [Clostridia bacterium]
MANKPKWTPEQRHAIDARGGTLIVSAAAGSGKTAVLVERCIQRLTDTEHPCSADELLIVTFTRAATAEMRSRLAKAISDRLVEDPENTHLQKQQMLLPSAQICTIDAFCGNLVRENFESLGISPDFRLLDESEVRVLQQNAIDQVMEEFYTSKDPDFLGLVELLATGRDDTSLEGNILRLYTYSRAYPSPKHWLENGLSLYEDPSAAYRLLKESWAEYFDSWVLRWEHFQRLLEKEQGQSDIDYSESVESVKGYIALAEEFLELLENEDWAGFLTRLTGLSQADIPTWKKPSLPKKQTTAVIEYGKGLKSSFTPGKLRDVLKKLPMTLPEEAAKDLSLLRPYARKLVDTVLRFDEVYGDLKKEANALDFADTELKALELLVKDPAEEPFRRTELAETLRLQFREVLIDEYQDTNKLQDTIFAALSRDDLFMVGDVKQSIYRFRQAMPELFLQKKASYPLYDEEKNEYPATVVLGKNFRSRKGVLSAVNYTFSRLMSPEVGEIEYNEEEELRFGAEAAYKDREEPDVEFHVVIPEQGRDKREAEALHIARYIEEEVQKSKGAENPLTYRDFAILLQSPGTTAAVYRKVLTDYGIPVYAETGAGFLDTPEVMTVLSFLAVIDNPVQDVPLLSVLLSPLAGFREDEVAALRVRSRKGSLYAAVLKGEEEGDPHCEEFLRDLRHFRTLSVSMGAGDLLRRIYEETSFDAIVGAMNVGDQRIATLQMLLQYGDRYAANCYYGTAGFVRYIHRLREQDA